MIGTRCVPDVVGTTFAPPACGKVQYQNAFLFLSNLAVVDARVVQIHAVGGSRCVPDVVGTTFAPQTCAQAHYQNALG